uniref:Uncharacterized protein n=1 Tax=Medicago truncatula TaxID=3880 RepID=I3SJS0_MEDTR|nr:unknown [Medicago truncatula]
MCHLDQSMVSQYGGSTSFLRYLTGPGDKTTVKRPFSLMYFSERSATYLAKDTARCSLLSTCTSLLLFIDAFTKPPT